ncbi:translocase subunit seca [Senna tora]|uniref:Translocase subunit seca n=1 Tax=Senna tora TaxID=362788 RepID=A0A834TU50_9FABA|nr:translocase subunit seca [Senna tora]
MNHCVIQQQNVVASFEEMSGRDPVVCPKPRRLGLLNVAVNDHPPRSFRWHLSCQTELFDPKSGSDPLDFILTKGGCGIEQPYTQVASPPPFFCGSPPSRVANPLIQDARFGDEMFSPLSPSSRVPTPSGKGGCVRANFGNNPAVRVEGFDCLDRDRRNCSIPALA